MKYKNDLEDSKRRYARWWDRKGLVLRSWYEPEAEGPAGSAPPPPAATPEALVRDPAVRARHNDIELSRRAFPGDSIPVSSLEFGTDALAPLLGCEVSFADATIWYHPAQTHIGGTDSIVAPVFDPTSGWWRIMEDTARRCKALADGRYYVGLPSMTGGLDTLGALRGTQELMMDLLDDPEWVRGQLEAIHVVWREVYDRLHAIADQDGWTYHKPFCVFGPGKCAQVQCDAAAMLSPEMFREFELPVLTERCRHLDHSMYHLDGTQALCHLDTLLGIEELDAIEWTPQAGIESGGNPRWFDLYRRILEAGKSVQVVGVGPEELQPLLDAIGTEGVFVILAYLREGELRRICDSVLQSAVEGKRHDRIDDPNKAPLS